MVLTTFIRRSLLALVPLMLLAGILTFVHFKRSLPEDFIFMSPDSLTWTECWMEVPWFTAVHCAWLSPQPGVKIPVAIIRRSIVPKNFRPLLYVNGGPGSPSIGFFGDFAGWIEELQALDADRDLVLFDFAGSGFSEPGYPCPEAPRLGHEVLAQNLSAREESRRYYQVYKDCHDSLVAAGRDLSMLTQPAMVNTLHALLATLPTVKWDIYAISYGTRVTLNLMRRAPRNLERVILDSVYPPQARGLTDFPRFYDAALNKLFTTCEDSAGCRRRYPDLRQSFYDMLKTLDENPLQVEFEAWPENAKLTMVINSHRMIDLVYMSMYDWSLIQELPEALWLASRGDPRALAPMAGMLHYYYTDSEYGDILYITSECADRAAGETAATVKARWQDYPALAPYVEGGWEVDICDAWSVPRVPDSYRRPVQSSVATLILTGELDPVTPPEYAHEAATTLSAARLEEFSGIGHGVVDSDICATDLAGLFLEGRESSIEYRLSCERREPPPLKLRGAGDARE